MPFAVCVQFHLVKNYGNLFLNLAPPQNKICSAAPAEYVPPPLLMPICRNFFCISASRLCVDMRARIMMSHKSRVAVVLLCTYAIVYTVRQWIWLCPRVENYPNFGSGCILFDHWLVWHVKVCIFFLHSLAAPCVFVELFRSIRSLGFNMGNSPQIFRHPVSHCPF